MLWVQVVVSIVSLLMSPALSSPDIHDLCPHTRFCTDGPLSLLNDSDARPCCLPCSCSDYCYEFGNCCPDISHQLIGPQTVPCRSQEEIYRQYLKRVIGPHFPNNLRVIDFCPEQTYDKTALQEARQRCYNGKELEDLVFVSDEYNRIYLNRFCAECNGVTNFTAWDLRIPCHGILTLEVSSIKELTNFIFNTCDVFSKPPEDFNLAAVVCSTSSIANCNVTGLWDFYDDEIEWNCKTHGMPYALNLQEWYANVYCFICNNPRNTHISSKCGLFDPDERSYVFLPPFTALLKPYESTEWESQHTERLVGCTYTEIYDPFTKQCMKLMCPYGTLPKDGKCKAYVKTTENYCLAISFKIKLTDQQKSVFQTSDAGFLANSTYNLVKRILDQLRIDCGFGYLQVTDTPDKGDINVEVSMFSTETCSYLKLLKAYAMLARESIVEATVDGKQVTLPLDMCFNEECIPVANIYWFEADVDCLPTFFTNQTVYCPSIDYNPENTYFNRDIAAELLNVSVRINEQSYRICLADYEVLTKPLISSGCIGTAVKKIFFLSTCLSLLGPRL